MRPVPSDLRRHERGRRPRFDRVSPDLARHQCDDRSGERTRRSGGPHERAHQDPRDQGRLGRDYRGHRLGHLGERHPDFSLKRYADVIDAYLAGHEQAKAAGIDLSGIHSVASFLVSRVDTVVDNRLRAMGTDEATALVSKAGITNARLAYELLDERFVQTRATDLLAAGATVQRPIRASTGVKDPALRDTLYVTELVAAGTVNAMPEKTLQATFDHGVIAGDTIATNYADAHAVINGLAAVGIDIADVPRYSKTKSCRNLSPPGATSRTPSPQHWPTL